jgi:predicted house-cleaning NTP pyrophosphatase (Maf/HAM1 superfamily)
MGLECSRFDDSVDDDVIEDDETEEVAPQERCSKSALARAKAVSAKHPDALVIVACQIVFANGAVLTKPAKPSMAMEQLRSLSGKTISYFTGLAVVHEASQRFVTAVEVTKVTVSDLKCVHARARVSDD